MLPLTFSARWFSSVAESLTSRKERAIYGIHGIPLITAYIISNVLTHVSMWQIGKLLAVAWLVDVLTDKLLHIVALCNAWWCNYCWWTQEWKQLFQVFLVCIILRHISQRKGWVEARWEVRTAHTTHVWYAWTVGAILRLWGTKRCISDKHIVVVVCDI